MTPANIIGMAKLKELDVIAITDHNTCQNCGPAMQLGEEYGVLVLPGMELTTEEEVHVVCLFSELNDALAFDEYVYQKLIKIRNNEDIFGKQLVVDAEERILRHESYLLINATNISFSEVYELTTRFHGIMIPAHVDKSSNSLLSNLGFVPPDSQFECVEIKEESKVTELLRNNPYLQGCKVITNSDAHSLMDINEPIHWLHAVAKTRASVLQALARRAT